MINFVRLTFNIYSQLYIAGVTVLHKVLLDIPCMVVYSCKKCGELNYLIPHAIWNIADFDAKSEKCETINTITLEEGELKIQV